MPDQLIDRQGPGRRVVDTMCQEHDEEMRSIKEDMDSISASVAKNAGRFASMLWFMGIVGAAMGLGITVVITMLLNIQSSINSNNVASAEDRKDIKTIREVEIPQIRKEITNIEERHKFEDQNRGRR